MRLKLLICVLPTWRIESWIAAALAMWISMPWFARAEDISLWLRDAGCRAEFDAQGHLVGIDGAYAWLTDGDLKRLASIETLRRINLSYTKINDEGLELLQPLVHVQELRLRYAESITDLGVSYLKHWKELELLDLRGTKVTSSVLEHVSNMSRLRSLDVGFTRVNDDSFERLVDLPNLERFSLGGNKMSGAALPLLKLAPNLKTLELGGQQRTDSGLWSIQVLDSNVGHIAELTALTALDVSGSSISDRGLSRLTSLRKLESIDLSRTKVSGQGLAHLKSLPSLRHLKFNHAGAADDEALLELSQFPSLEIVEMQGAKVTERELSQFEPPHSLQRIYLGGVNVSAEAIAQLQARTKGCWISWWPPLVESNDSAP
jgi:hypothetical protein